VTEPTLAATGGEVALFTAQVRWSDPDQMGHVNHAKYLTYFEDARIAFVSGMPRPSGGLGFIAARVACDYLAPVEFRQGLTLQARSWVGRIGSTAWTLWGELFDGERRVARSEVVMVGYSYPDASKRELTVEERAYLARYVEQ
jgi:acyl-CoA thioester hydrolase